MRSNSRHDGSNLVILRALPHRHPLGPVKLLSKVGYRAASEGYAVLVAVVPDIVAQTTAIRDSLDRYGGHSL